MRAISTSISVTNPDLTYVVSIVSWSVWPYLQLHVLIHPVLLTLLQVSLPEQLLIITYAPPPQTTAHSMGVTAIKVQLLGS